MKINVTVVTETKKKLEGTEQIEKHAMIYSGVSAKQLAAKAVAMLIDNKWTRRIESYTFINDRKMNVLFRIL